MCACVCVCVCVCARARRAPKQTSKVHSELRARPNDQIHTQYVKTAGLESSVVTILEFLTSDTLKNIDIRYHFRYQGEKKTATTLRGQLLLFFLINIT